MMLSGVNRQLFVLALICGALWFPAKAQAQTARVQITEAVARLEKVLSQLELSEEDAKRQAAQLGYVRQAIDAGHLYLSIYRLQPVWMDIMAQAYVRSKAGLEAKGVEAFEKEWQRLGVELDEKERQLNSQAEAAKNVAALLALSESSVTLVRPYYQSGRLYGLNTTIGSGLYYMGLAPAGLDFALLCRGLRLPRDKAPFKFRSLDAELTKLEKDVLESYRREESGNNQPQFNRINSTLKMATELNREKRYAGALQRYLETVMFLYLLDAEATYAKDLPRLASQSRLLENRLKASSSDQSIGLIFIESAQLGLAPQATGQPERESFKRAAVIIDRVLPAYLQIVGETNK